MGYFTDINNSSERAQGVADYNRANGVNGHTALGVIASQYGPSIFMSLTSKIASSAIFEINFSKVSKIDFKPSL